MKLPKLLLAAALFAVFPAVLASAAYGEGREMTGLYADEIISAEELSSLLVRRTDIVLFDARGRESYADGHLEGAVLPYPQEYYRQLEMFRNKIISSPPDRIRALEEGMRDYSKDTPIVTYCSRGCSASAVLLLELKRIGFQNVRALRDGVQGWEEHGYALVRGKSSP